MSDPILTLKTRHTYHAQKEAIFFAWDLLTRIFKLPKDQLYVTYFGGNKKYNLEPDFEARDIWLSTGWVEWE